MEIQLPSGASSPSLILFVHFYIYPNLLKLNLMSIAEQPSDRPQLET